jgi:flagellar protein FlgJ
MMDDKNSFLLSASAHLSQQYPNQKVGSALKSVKNQASDQADLQLREACKEMESLFVNYLFQEMRATIDKSGFISGGRAEEIFTSMLDVELSRKISASGGIGLSAILLEQLGAKAKSETPVQQGPGSDKSLKFQGISTDTSYVK